MTRGQSGPVCMPGVLGCHAGMPGVPFGVRAFRSGVHRVLVRMAFLLGVLAFMALLCVLAFRSAHSIRTDTRKLVSSTIAKHRIHTLHSPLNSYAIVYSST